MFDEMGIGVLASSVGLIFVSLICYAVCKGLSELVFRSYLKFKIDEHNMLEDEIIFDEIKYATR